jgi:hypothetical protein
MSMDESWKELARADVKMLSEYYDHIMHCDQCFAAYNAIRMHFVNSKLGLAGDKK